MKYLFVLFSVCFVFVLTGCFSPTSTTVTEYNADGKVMKVTATTESVIKSVTGSTKDKSIVVWESGWLAYLSASTATTDDPTPTFKMGAGKVDKGAISLHKDHKDLNIADVIKATRSDLEVTTTGVSEKKNE
jgi:hypothetical protein